MVLTESEMKRQIDILMASNKKGIIGDSVEQLNESSAEKKEPKILKGFKSL